MELQTVAIAATGAGALCELVGLGLVVSEIAEDRKRAREFLRTLAPRQTPQRSYPPRPSGLTAVTPPAITSEGLVRAWAGLVGQIIEMRKSIDSDLDRSISTVYADVAQRDKALSEGLRYVLAGSTSKRIWGVGLLAVGIILAAGGSIVSSLA